jgi:DNA-binding response OmpR family regulator
MSKLIYIAEDEQNIRHLIQSFLLKEGYRVEVFENGDLLYDAFIKEPCDLVILDIIMPGSSGLIICTKLREISEVPIFMLTAKDTDEDYISGISLGSDDYFTKPFNPVQLVMRVKALFRRINMEANIKDNADSKVEIIFSDLTVSTNRLIIFCKNSELALTNTEYRFLVYLLENKDKAVPRDELFSKIWGYDCEIETRAIDDTVKRLRRKLSAAESSVSIDTIRGFGFRIGAKDVLV